MLPILMYHSIAQVPEQYDPLGLAVPRKLFEQQMAALYRAGYRCLSLSDAVRRWRGGLSQPRKSFVLTFDDGYQNLYTEAWPILERYGFTATVFLVVGRMGRQSDWGQQVGPAATRLLSWAEARELSRLGVAFGSHTLTHPRLTLLDDARAEHEIRQSKALIEEHLGVGACLFSYPYGEFDTRIQRMVVESGYTAACGVDRGPWGLLNLWRAQCSSGTTLRAFGCKARGWHHRLIWLREQSCLRRPLRYVVRALKRGALIEKHHPGRTGQ